MNFQFNAEDASKNGYVQEFTFEKSIEVVAMDRVSNIEILMANALKDGNLEVFNALNENFHLNRTSGNKTIIIRQKKILNDYKILNYLCSIGFNGFASKPINNQVADISLCVANEYLSDGHYSKYNQNFVVGEKKLLSMPFN
jgi:hypothetical protein